MDIKIETRIETQRPTQRSCRERARRFLLSLCIDIHHNMSDCVWIVSLPVEVLTSQVRSRARMIPSTHRAVTRRRENVYMWFYDIKIELNLVSPRYL